MQSNAYITQNVVTVRAIWVLPGCPCAYVLHTNYVNTCTNTLDLVLLCLKNDLANQPFSELLVWLTVPDSHANCHHKLNDYIAQEICTKPMAGPVNSNPVPLEVLIRPNNSSITWIRTAYSLARSLHYSLLGLPCQGLIWGGGTPGFPLPRKLPSNIIIMALSCPPTACYSYAELAINLSSFICWVVSICICTGCCYARPLLWLAEVAPWGKYDILISNVLPHRKYDIEYNPCLLPRKQGSVVNIY